MDKRLERILPRVQKPARYTGGEYNQILKNKDEVDIRLAFCFPDTYEIGMSNLGMSILYETMNSLPFVWCERVFAPWGDMYDEMKKAGIPLYALESGDAVGDFDSLAFSIGYEMAYTTVLDMLDMAGIPLRTADRPGLLPLIWAGGTAAVNAEPMAPFLDLFVVGEGEELDNEVLTLLREAKLSGWSKHEFLTKAAQIQGVYVPSLYDVSYHDDGTVAAVTPRDGAPARVTKRIVSDLDAAPYPTRPIVPSTEVIHDRVSLELFRGCPRGCRFCQAGHVYRPLRAKKPETLIRQGIESLENTGHEDVTLLSLSTSDYRQLPALCDGLLEYCEPRSIGLSLPSLRADNFSMEIMERLQKVRKSGLTFAEPDPPLLAGERKEQEPGREDHHLHLLLHPQAPQPLPVGGADPPAGVSAAREPAALRHHRQKRDLQLARCGDQSHRGGALQGRPAGGRRHRGGLAPGRAAGRLDGLFLLPALDGRLSDLRRGRGFLRPPGSGEGRDPALGSHRRGRAQGPPVERAGEVLPFRALAGLPAPVRRLRCRQAAGKGVYLR